MGETFQEAMLKNIDTRSGLSEREKLNWIDNILIMDNPLSLSSGDLELRLFTYKHAINVKQVRELTTTEEQCVNFISRLYKPYELKLIDNIFAIEFTQYDMDVFYNKIRTNNSTINPVKPINPISYINLNNKKVWRIILFENIDDYILRNSLENIDINDTQGLINEIIKLSV